MAASNFPITLDRTLRNQFFHIPDPGASGTFSWQNKGEAIVECSTASGAQARTLPAAAGFGVGTRLTVILTVDNGDLTINGALSGAVVMNDVGDVSVFVVSKSGTSNVWKNLVNV